MSKNKKQILEEVKKLKLERQRVKDRLKKWAKGDVSIYDGDGMRVERDGL